MRRVASLYVMLVLSCAGALQAQSTNATLTGRVTDASKASILNAKVTLINTGTNLHYESTTNETGTYYVTNLPAGTYRMEVEKVGFKTVIKPDIILHVQDALEVNFEMAVGSLAETITVEAGAPTVQLTTSSIGAVVNSTTVRELPLNGRSWTDLAALQPGVNTIQTQAAFTTGVARGNRGFGDQITVGGARPMQNNYRIDGISINDHANGGPGSVLGGNLGVDAIQEFSVLTSNYSAEYGKTAGGVVNAITRSGTNQFHGGAYEFLRNSALDARNFFDNGKIPPFRRNQFGADGGGPIRKDKVFVFGDYEGIRQSKGITHVNTVPSPAARLGILCSKPDTTPPCTQNTLTVDSSAQKYLPFWSLPNGGIQPGSNGDIGIFTFAGQQVINENFFTIRVDNKISDKDILGVTYLGDFTPYSAPGDLNAVLLSSKTNRQIATLEETHIFGPSLVNSVRVGYNRAAVVNDKAVAAINPLAKDPSLAAIPGQFASPVSVSGLTGFPGGVNASNHYLYHWNSFQEYDDASWTHGTHSLKFGGGVERMQLNAYAVTDPGGNFSFGSLSDFLTNNPQRFAAGFNTLQSLGLRQSLLGLYIQDDWRARPNLTLNMGLRWEMVTVPTEVRGKLATLINIRDRLPICGVLVTGSCSGTGPLYSNPTLRNFSPRVGFAWDPFHNGKTAVHGGFGFFDVLPLPYQFYIMTNQAFPFFTEGNAVNNLQGTFFNKAVQVLGPASNREVHVEQHPHRNYVMQWNLNVQRELAPSVTAVVGYVGSRGVHQPFRVDDIDIVLPKKTPAGYLFPSPVGSGTTVNPNFGQIFGMFYGGDSFYDALEVGMQKRMSGGVQLQGSFTWGKSIDTSSSTVAGDQFGNSISSLPWYDLKLMRGLSDFNIGRTLVINGTWQVPSPKSFSGPAAWITNGWELGGIFKVSDGVPFTATWGTDGDPQGLKNSDPWAFPNRLGGPGCNPLVNPGNPNNYIKTQCFAVPTAPTARFYNANCDPTRGTFPQCFNLRGNAGRNILIGPGTLNLDFSVFKNNYIRRISENFNVQFRAEFFNILNRANFAGPVLPNNTDIFDSTGARTGVAGLLTSTTTTAREIQFALKIMW